MIKKIIKNYLNKLFQEIKSYYRWINHKLQKVFNVKLRQLKFLDKLTNSKLILD